MPMIIKPTPGRVVWYWPSQNEIDAKQFAYADLTQPLAATVAYAHSDSLVNLSVVDQNGAQFRRTSVQLIQDGEDRPHTSQQSFAEWMPYQRTQAAKDSAPAPTGENVDTGGDKASASTPSVETKKYPDGTTATGTPPLPEASPTAATAPASAAKKTSAKGKKAAGA